MRFRTCIWRRKSLSLSAQESKFGPDLLPNGSRHFASRFCFRRLSQPNYNRPRGLPENRRNLLIFGGPEPHWPKQKNKFYILFTLRKPYWHEACIVRRYFSRSVPACGFCCVARLARVRGSSKAVKVQSEWWTKCECCLSRQRIGVSKVADETKSIGMGKGRR